MAMEFNPNMGTGSKQLENKLCTFSGHFYARNGFWCRLNLLENMLNAGFLCTIVLVCENWEKKIPVCMCCILYE